MNIFGDFTRKSLKQNDVNKIPNEVSEEEQNLIENFKTLNTVICYIILSCIFS